FRFPGLPARHSADWAGYLMARRGSDLDHRPPRDGDRVAVGTALVSFQSECAGTAAGRPPAQPGRTAIRVYAAAPGHAGAQAAGARRRLGQRSPRASTRAPAQADRPAAVLAREFA